MGLNIEGSGFTLTEPVVTSPCVIHGNVSQPYTDVHETSATQQFKLGTKLILPDGRVFRYAKNGGTALAKAYMTTSEANYARLVDELQSTSGTSAAVGDYQINIDVTTGGTWVTDELSGGYMLVNKATGIGDIYEVIANEISSTDTLMRVLLRHPLRTALDATSELTLIKSPFRDVDVMPTAAEGTPTGIPLVAVTANYYCWLQVGGIAPCYVDTGDTLVKGEPAGHPATPAVAGACGPIGASTDSFWGTAVYVATAGEVAMIDLKLAS